MRIGFGARRAAVLAAFGFGAAAGGCSPLSAWDRPQPAHRWTDSGRVVDDGREPRAESDAWEASPGRWTAQGLGRKQPIGHADLRVHYFTQDDGPNDRGGNPNIDEHLQVVEFIGVAEGKPDPSWDIKVKGLYDDIRTGSDAAVTSGASGKHHLDRKAGNIFGGHTFGLGREGAFRLGAMLGISDETARYRSYQFGLDCSQELFGKNLTWSAGLTCYEDTAQIVRWDGTNQGSGAKHTLGAHAGLTWVLTPSFVASWFANYTLQQGLLDKPGNYVTYTDAMGAVQKDTDRLPGRRNRFFTGLSGRYSLDWLAGASWEATWRIYYDDFGTLANGGSLWFRQQVTDHVMLRARYRFYTQTASRYWRGTLEYLPAYRTQDAAAGEFMSHTVGLQGVLMGEGPDGHQGEVDLSLDYYFRDDGLSGWLIGLGARLAF